MADQLAGVKPSNIIVTARDGDGRALDSAFATTAPIFTVDDDRSRSVKRVASGVGKDRSSCKRYTVF